MAVIGRLWRRAPLWRMCVVTCVACTGLTAMFPPALPRIPQPPPGWLPWQKSGSTASGTAAAHYATQQDPVATGNIGMQQPPIGQGRQDLMPYAGRTLPLPAGIWQVLVVARVDDEVSQQVSMLARIENNRVTGMMLVEAPNALSGRPGPIIQPELCLGLGSLASHMTPRLPGQSPMQHQCWNLAFADMTGLEGRKSENDLLQLGFRRLDGLNIGIPDQMLIVRAISSDETGFLTTTIFLPDHRSASHSAGRKLQEWAQHYSELLQKGFDGTLRPGDLVLIRDE